MKDDNLKEKIFVVMEVIMPPLIHMLNLSIVEIVIHGQIFYQVMSDFSSVLFMMSLAMIFQACRKKILPEIEKIPTKMILVVSWLI